MNKKAFSLVELIVWITISMILMVSVGIFISSWMQNIISWEKVIKNINDFSNFANKINNNLFLLNNSKYSAIKAWSWLLFKSSNYFDKWWFTFIWSQKLEWIYCEDDSESYETNNIFIKNFIPFEENSENILTNFEDILTANAWIYTSYQNEHKVTDNAWNIIIWKWIFWNYFQDWADWEDIYLNSPTWLAFDSINNILYVSDTLNNRILYYDVSSWKIYKLLWENDWINEATWLYYNESEKVLYISNSWNWEILKYSSKNYSSSPQLNIKIDEDIIWVNKLNLYFYKDNLANDINSINETDYNFIWFSKDDDYLNISWNKAEYLFLNYASFPSSQLVCWSWEKYNWWNPVNCISTWTWQSSWFNYISINSNDEIQVNNINLNDSSTWNNYVKLELLNNSEIRYSKYFPFYTNWDDDLRTKNDNSLEIIHSNLNYPNWIWWENNYNEFNYNNSYNFSYSNWDYILNSPIENLEIDLIDNNLLSFILNYYRNYNCYNLDDKSKRTFISKKNLK